MISTMPTVVCTQCRRENEIERIYCHDCGSRLERKQAIQKIAAPKKEDTHKRLKKLFDPQRARIRALFFKISKVVLAACGAAGLTVLALPPELPAVAKNPQMQTPTIGFDLERLVARKEPTQVKYTEDQTNLFLAYNLKPKKKALDQPLLDFQRAVTAFHEGTASVTMERALFGYSLFTTIDFAPATENGKARVKAVGASIGRMPIHPELAKYMNYLFLDLWGALDREKKVAERVSSVEFHDNSVQLVWMP
jgi:hypothetical protein